MPRFEFVEGSSSKFWEIHLEESTVRTRWGRIGSEGQEKEEDFDSRTEARKEYDKLIASKVKKGYKPVAEERVPKSASNPELEAAILKDPEGVDGYLVYGDWLQAQGDVRGELVALQAAQLQGESSRHHQEEKVLLEKHKEALLGEVAEHLEYVQLTWHLGFLKSARVAVEYDAEVEMGELLPALLSSPSARFLRELTVGLASSEGENDYDDVIKVIARSAPRTLRSLFIGDFTSDETELSWSNMGNAAPLWKALPGLREVKLRSGSMTLGTLELPECRRFVVETGGLSRASMKSIAQATWPRLEVLEVWFGSESYGAECTVKDVQPVLEGKGLGSLKELGLMNAEFTADLVKVLPGSKVLPQLTRLDLSMGTLADPEVDTVLAAQPALAHLRELDLSENLLSEGAVERLRAMGPFVKADNQREMYDEDERYVAVGE
jgi:uncharacterized protein (TIGR02996 family)